MSDKNKRLKDSSLILKERIKDLKSPPIYPVSDGIINITKYCNADFKIMWILKESNDLKKKDGVLCNTYWDLCEKVDEMTWAKQKNIRAGLNVFRRLSYCSYYILHRQEYEEKNQIQMNENIWDAFKSTAYINVKKLPGGSSVKDEIIQTVYNDAKNKEILHDQINEFNPDIIIGCNTLKYFSEHFKFNRQEKKYFSYPWLRKDQGYYPQKERLFIDICHPGNRKLKGGIGDREFLHAIMSCFSDWILNYKG